jgi:hypothetical protein
MSKNVQGEYDTAETTKALGKMSRRNFETELAELQVELTSRPREFHPRALPEPYVTLSSHTAPDVRPVP